MKDKLKLFYNFVAKYSPYIVTLSFVYFVIGTYAVLPAVVNAVVLVMGCFAYFVMNREMAILRDKGIYDKGFEDGKNSK